MNGRTRVIVLLVAAIFACAISIVAFEDPGEVLSLTGFSWLAIAIACVAGALLP